MPEETVVAEEKKEEWSHPLFLKQVSERTLSWEKWKEYWAAETDLSALVNLLHLAFKIDLGDWNPLELRERTVFFFETAYGYEEDCPFWTHPSRRTDSYYRCELEYSDALRARLAKEAWGILCQRILQNTEKDKHGLPSWYSAIVNKTVLPRVIWFFSLESNFPKLSLEKTHDAIVAREFLHKLCRLGWSDNNKIGRSDGSLLAGHRKSFVRFLCALKETDWLVKVYTNISDEIMDELRAIALEDTPFYGSPPFATVEEVAVAGDKGKLVARTYILLRALKDEHNRQSAILNEVDSEYGRLHDEVRQLQNEYGEMKKALNLSIPGMNKPQIEARMKEIEKLHPIKKKEAEKALGKKLEINRLYPYYRS